MWAQPEAAMLPDRLKLDFEGFSIHFFG